MKLVLTLLLRDEEDTLRANIEFHLAQGVDFIIATDNRSTDGTPDILAEYERAGVLRAIREDADDYAQHAWVTRMARLAASDYDATWVVNCDADEFWHPTHGSLREVLAAVHPNTQAAVAPRSNFPPITGALTKTFYQSQIWRDTRSETMIGTPLPPKVCHRAFRTIEVKQGNHGVLLDGKLVATTPLPISIAHFPLRSYEQFERKIRLGGAAYMRNTTLPPSVGRTWRDMYAMLAEGRLRDAYQTQGLSPDPAQRTESSRFVRDVRLRDALDALHQQGRNVGFVGSSTP